MIYLSSIMQLQQFLPSPRQGPQPTIPRGLQTAKKINPDPGQCERMEFYEHVPHEECWWDFGIYLYFN